MKKLIYCALALAAGLFATSCMQENLELKIIRREPGMTTK